MQEPSKSQKCFWFSCRRKILPPSPFLPLVLLQTPATVSEAQSSQDMRWRCISLIDSLYASSKTYIHMCLCLRLFADFIENSCYWLSFCTIRNWFWKRLDWSTTSWRISPLPVPPPTTGWSLRKMSGPNLSWRRTTRRRWRTSSRWRGRRRWTGGSTCWCGQSFRMCLTSRRWNHWKENSSSRVFVRYGFVLFVLFDCANNMTIVIFLTYSECDLFFSFSCSRKF